MALRGLSCSWLCGTGASGDTAIDLSGSTARIRSPSTSSYADAGASAGPFPFTSIAHPAQPQIHVAPDPSSSAGWWSRADRASPRRDRG